MTAPPLTGDLIATLCGDDEIAALAMVERLGRVIDEPFSKDAEAAVCALVTSLAAAQRPRVRAACAHAISKLACWPDSPAGPINVGEAARALVALCQAARTERERDVRLAVIAAIEKQAPYRERGPEPDTIDQLLLECAASHDVAERRVAQGAILFRIDNACDSGYGPGDEAVLRKAFARDRSEFARFLAQDRANEQTEWARLLEVGETTPEAVEDALGPPDEPPYVAFRKASPCPPAWRYDFAHPARLLFVFRFDSANRWRLRSSGYEQTSAT